MSTADAHDIKTKAYLEVLANRERPIPYDSPFLLPPRPNPPPPNQPTNPLPPISYPRFPSAEEKERLSSLYYTTAALPASQSFSDFPEDVVTEVIPGAAWVLKLLTPEECNNAIESGEQHGLHRPENPHSLRSMQRTSNFMSPSLSTLVGSKLPEQLLELLESTAPYTSVRGLHPNWRVAKYGPGETFPAHIDNSDAITVVSEEGARELLTSSHTLLLHLSERSSYGGGATRLFPQGRYDVGAVDVELPRGFALVFQQKGLLHAGLALRESGKFQQKGLLHAGLALRESGKLEPGAKYIAQAGVLRGQAQVGRGGAPAIFKYGAGLQSLF